MTTLYKGYRPTIGLEVHAELSTTTKMFCDSKNEPHATEPNIHVCPVCMGQPGTLPVINEKAVMHVLRVGVAVGGILADYTEFDRKNYFYPDIPKGYQISQYQFPLVRGGTLQGIALTRIHLEEDTARSLHDQGEGSLVDYNRAGVPLMELVTEPLIHDAHTAGDFARELQLLLRTLGASGANMEKGEMRVEANISVSKSDTLGTKVEVKNLNSFKAVIAAIEYEICRQVDLIEEGGAVTQETRGWDEHKGKTFSQRLKESADDYRYFPEPDIPKLKMSLSERFIQSRINEKVPPLPQFKREKYSNLGLPIEQIEIIISNQGTDTFFATFTEMVNGVEAVRVEIVRLGANYLTSDIVSHMNQGRELTTASTSHFVALMNLVHESKITSRSAKDLIAEVVFENKDPMILAKERNLIQQNDMSEIERIADEVIQMNGNVVEEYRSGKESSIQFLVGQGMKLSKGTVNPTKLREILAEKLK